MDYSKHPSPHISRIAEKIDAHARSHRLSFSHIPLRIRSAFEAWNLIMDTEYHIAEWAPVILDDLCSNFSGTPRTKQKKLAEAERFLNTISQRRATWNDLQQPDVVKFYTLARPDHHGEFPQVSKATARNRRWAVRAVLESAACLGVNIDPAELLGPPLKVTKPDNPSRPLSAAEAEQVQTFADQGIGGSMRSVLVSLAFAGASASEIAHLTPADLDLHTGTVRLRGAAERVNKLPEWSRETIARHLRTRPDTPPPDVVLCVSPDLPNLRAIHAVTVRLRQVIVDAGLADVGGVTATSIRLTTAKHIYETQGLVAATDFLGKDSFDRAAAALGVAPRRRAHGTDDG